MKKAVILLICFFFVSCERKSESQILEDLLRGSSFEGVAFDVHRVSVGKDSVFSFRIQYDEKFGRQDFEELSFQSVSEKKDMKRILVNAERAYPSVEFTTGNNVVFQSFYSGFWMEVVDAKDCLIVFANRF